ncbi:MAG: radical SAM (seleno)protein TrsS [Syntrophobacteraceae bacterium]
MMEGILLSETESVCPECLAAIPARRVARGDDVYLVKNCPEHGRFEAVIWRGMTHYASWVRPKLSSYPTFPSTPVRMGCPRDCGLCPEHRQTTCTALIEVTQRCNLQCPFCFADAGQDCIEDPSPSQIEALLLTLRAASGLCNVQLSGGEPTLREDLPEIVSRARTLGFPFVQLNTNGLRLANEPSYVKALSEAGLSSVFLQFDSVEDSVYRRLRARDLFRQKQLAIDHCSGNGIGVVLVPTIVPGINVDQIGPIIQFAVQGMPGIRGVHFQPVSYFGRFPVAPSDEDRITIPDVLAAMEAQTTGLIRTAHFSPPACENAFCSFHGNFVLLADGKLHPWSQPNSSQCGCKPIPAAEGATRARRFVSEFWAAPRNPPLPPDTPSAPGLGGWDDFLDRVRTHSLCISGMAFQDVWNLDLERLRDCCIHVVHPDGRIIPFCAYNLTDRHGQFYYRPTAHRDFDQRLPTAET